MIKNFKHKGLERFFTTSNAKGIPAASASRIKRMLDVLHASAQPSDMDVPGYHYHPLTGPMAGRHSTRVTGSLRLTFGWKEADAVDVDLEDYH